MTLRSSDVDVWGSLAPIQVRGQRLLSAGLVPFMVLAGISFGVINLYRGATGTAVLFLSLTLIPISVAAIVWPSHLRAARRAARGSEGVKYLIFGAYRWGASIGLEDPWQGEKIGHGFIVIEPGSFELRAGEGFGSVARYEAGQLENAVVLRVMRGFFEPLVRLTFTDGVTYDITLDYAGPRGILPTRRRRLEAFNATVREALSPIPTAA